MPIINIQMLGSATSEQKAQIVEEITNTMVNILGKNPQNTHIIFNEKSAEDWGHAGELVANRKK